MFDVVLGSCPILCGLVEHNTVGDELDEQGRERFDEVDDVA